MVAVGDQALPWDLGRSENLAVFQNNSGQWEKVWVGAQKSQRCFKELAFPFKAWPVLFRRPGALFRP